MNDTIMFQNEVVILENEEFFYDDSFIDYNQINIKEFFYDDSFDDYLKFEPTKELIHLF